MNITNAQTPTGLVQQYIGTAYDNVRKVADEMENIVALAQAVDDQTDFAAMAAVVTSLGESASDLASLATADLTAISDDLVKGNYLGNRKIDINLALNNNSTTSEVTYQGVTITLNTGAQFDINFTTLDGESNTVIEELASYTSIFNAIKDGIDAYNAGEPDPQQHVVNTEMDIINSTLEHLPTMIRIRDSDGRASSIDRIQLHSYSGEAVEDKPVYFWSKTTSSLQTLANRAGDIIALGNDIDSIIALAQQTDELGFLYQHRNELVLAGNSLYANGALMVEIYNHLTAIANVSANQAAVNTVNDNLPVITSVHSNITAIIDAETHANTATQKALEAATSATQANTFRQQASDSAASATEQAGIAAARANEIKAVTVGNTVTSVPGSSAFVDYNPLTGSFTFAIPRGDKGEKGDAFQVNAVGAIADRSTYDTQLKGFAFLALDETKIYFKLSDTSGDWSVGSLFGKGEKGDTGDQGNGILSIVFESTTDGSGNPAQSGGTDTYRITFNDLTTSAFAVYNGQDANINDAGLSLTEVWSSNKVNTELGTKVDNSRVLTDVPAGAVFTDTVYSHPATHDVSEITGLGTSSIKDVPASGDATSDQIVMGDDSRLDPFWNEVDVTTNTTVAHRQLCKVDTSSNPIDLTLDPSAPEGARIRVVDITGNWGINPIKLLRGTDTIMNREGNMSVTDSNVSFELIKKGTDWRVFL